MGSERFHWQTTQSNDEAAVRSLYEQLMAGWNKGSGEAFGAPFAEDGDLIGFRWHRILKAGTRSLHFTALVRQHGLKGPGSWEGSRACVS